VTKLVEARMQAMSDGVYDKTSHYMAFKLWQNIGKTRV